MAGSRKTIKNFQQPVIDLSSCTFILMSRKNTLLGSQNFKPIFIYFLYNYSLWSDYVRTPCPKTLKSSLISWFDDDRISQAMGCHGSHGGFWKLGDNCGMPILNLTGYIWIYDSKSPGYISPCHPIFSSFQACCKSHTGAQEGLHKTFGWAMAGSV